MQSQLSSMGIIVLLALLFMVVIVLGFVMQRRMYKTMLASKPKHETQGSEFANLYDDAIIAVRTKEREASHFSELSAIAGSMDPPKVSVNNLYTPHVLRRNVHVPEAQASDLVIFHVMTKEGRFFVGYELLQALLAGGMRFGDMNIFHRYQDPTGRGPLLFSLASATEPGTFDMQNIGAFSGRGLTFFLRKSGNPTIDQERMELMLHTAMQLAEDLDGILLDDKREPLEVLPETSELQYSVKENA